MRKLRAIKSTVLLLAVGWLLGEEAFARQPKWAIALHGGASVLPRDMPSGRLAAYRKTLTEALQLGVDSLKAGDSALDTTQKVVMSLEDCSLFNAGRGSVFDQAGGHAMDASIMDGRTMAVGGVAGVTSLKNPIHAARVVMDQTPHVLFRGRAAEQLAVRHGVETVPQNYFSVRWRFVKLVEKMLELGLKPPDAPLHGWPANADIGHGVRGYKEVGGTVGCVALDSSGRLAAATSTGGRNAKMVGRVGDSPIPGAGNYANASVAVGGTGKGEEYLRYFVAGRVAWLVESETKTLDEAVRYCLEDVLQPGDGGLIAVDKDGRIAMQTTTGSMPRGAADSSGRFGVAVWNDK